MTASVQNLEPAAAYLPSPQANAVSDKKLGSADSDGQSADFRSELELQHTSEAGTKSADRPEKNLNRAGKKTASQETEDPQLAAVTPLSVPEPPKFILPFTLVLGRPQEHAEEVSPEKPSQENVAAPELDPHGAPTLDLSDVQDTSPNVAAFVAEAASSAKISAPEAAPGTAPELKSELKARSQSQAQSQVQSQPQSQGSQPISKGELKLPQTSPLEPAPAAAAPEIPDSAPARPAALAFAVRVTAAPSNQRDATPQSDQPGASAPKSESQPPVASAARVAAVQPIQPDAGVPASPSQQPAAIPDAPATVRIPARYTAVAPILPKAEKELDPHADLKKSAGPALDSSLHSGEVAARVETTSRASVGGSQFQAPPPAPSAPHVERIIEPPAAPATTPNDIRVRVPDNNGGSTQVRFVESGGEVRVSVRTADAGLAQSLRTHLNDLSQRLADGGAPVEIWKPGADTAQSQNDHHQPNSEGRGSGGQHPGSQGRQQDQQEKRPAWLDEMEASLQEQNT